MDPRWERPNGGGATSGSPSGSVSKQHGPPSATSSFRERERESSPAAGDRSSFSIVFSASWVHITTPIGEGAFSRVYEGVYQNPETNDQSIVAVKVPVAIPTGHLHIRPGVPPCTCGSLFA